MIGFVGGWSLLAVRSRAGALERGGGEFFMPTEVEIVDVWVGQFKSRHALDDYLTNTYDEENEKHRFRCSRLTMNKHAAIMTL